MMRMRRLRWDLGKEGSCESVASNKLMDLHSDLLSRLEASVFDEVIPLELMRKGFKHVVAEILSKRDLQSHPDKLKEGGVGLQVFALFSRKSKLEDLFLQLSLFEVMSKLYRISQVRFKENLEEYPGEGLSALLMVEGLCPIDDRLELVPLLWEKGVRVFALTWNRVNPYASGAVVRGRRKGFGLGPLAPEILDVLDGLGAILDVSHLSDEGVEELLHLWRGGLLATHSNLRELRDHPRNISIPLAKAIADRGGMIGVNLYPDFLPEPSLEGVVRTVGYALDKVGRYAVALGGDLDGIPSTPEGFRDARDYVRLIELISDRYGEDVAERVGYLNALEFLRRNLPPRDGSR